jgi:Xaa-Pro aminopeptidase
MKPGMYEYEAQAIIEAAFTRGGAERPLSFNRRQRSLFDHLAL